MLGLVIAAWAAASQYYAIGAFPPSFKPTQLARSTASTQVALGVNSALVHTLHDPYVHNLSPRTADLGDILTSPELRRRIARAAGVRASELAVAPPVWTNLLRIQQWNTGPSRANQVLAERDPSQITLDSDAGAPPNAPVLDVSAQAPSMSLAGRLAAAVAPTLGAYVRDIQTAAATPPDARYDVRQLAPVT